MSVIFTPLYAKIAARLAFEGVPIGVIARSLLVPSEVVREHLKEAITTGLIVELPREDWPPTARHADHLPSIMAKDTEETMNKRCQRVFKLTPLQAGFMVVLLKREEATKEMLHHVVEQQRTFRRNRPNNPKETDPKMVDVVICLMRKRLKPYDITISTAWGDGYYLSAENRKKANDLINAAVKENADASQPSA